MRRHPLFALSIFCCCAFGFVGAPHDGFAADALPPPPSDPVAPVPRDRDYSWMPRATWFREHADHVAIAAAGEVDLLFVGDSITAGAKWSESWKKTFGGYRFANFGIGGDRTQNILWRLDNGAVGKLQPKVVVLLIGTNNLWSTPDDVADTARGVRAVVAKLHVSFPNARVLVLGIFPRDEKPGAEVRAKVKQVNAALATLDDGKTTLVRDIGGVFLESDGTLGTTVSPDHLHLSEEGYRRWAEAIAPTVAELLK